MKVNVIIDEVVHRKIMHWVNKSAYEVSGLGKVVFEKGVYRVIDAMLLPQRNTSTHTDIEGEDVTKAMHALRNTPGHMNFWWHSHVNMDVFWSQTDKDTIKAIGDGGWVLSTVFNKRNQMRTALYIKNPLTNPNFLADDYLFLDEISTQIYREQDEELVKEWDADYEKNVTNVTSLAGKWARDEAGKWEKIKKKKWKKKVLASGHEVDVLDEGPGEVDGDEGYPEWWALPCEDCGYLTCVCDVRSRVDRVCATNSDDAPVTVNHRHPAAPKAGPGVSGKFPNGVY